jgi:hypothetical protein
MSLTLALAVINAWPALLQADLQTGPSARDTLEIRLDGVDKLLLCDANCTIHVVVTNKGAETVSFELTRNPVVDWGLSVKRLDEKPMTDSKKTARLLSSERIPEPWSYRLDQLRAGESRRQSVSLRAYFDMEQPGVYAVRLVNPKHVFFLRAASGKAIPLFRTKDVLQVEVRAKTADTGEGDGATSDAKKSSQSKQK